jgi:manganese/zinc/iron transport system permease protein
MSSALIIIAVGVLIAVSCALIGSFLLLRQLTLLGDAISHAVLPGIVIAFLLTGSRSPLPMFIGAGVFGVLTVLLVDLFLRTRKLREDASIGVVFPGLFAVGVILVSRYAHHIDLDLDCVLYGEIAYAPMDLWLVDGASWGPKPLWVAAIVLALNVSVILLLFKELKLTTFDPRLAASLGFSPVLLHYLLMTLTSVTVVGAFESVGAILVVAMLVVPPATAYLLTDRLPTMLLLAALLGAAAAALGYAAAYWLDASIAGAMATTAGLMFLFALLAAPRHGMIGRWWTRRRLISSLTDELLLAHLSADQPTAAAHIAHSFGWSENRAVRALDRLVGLNRVIRDERGYRCV